MSSSTIKMLVQMRDSLNRQAKDSKDRMEILASAHMLIHTAIEVGEELEPEINESNVIFHDVICMEYGQLEELNDKLKMSSTALSSIINDLHVKEDNAV